MKPAQEFDPRNHALSAVYPRKPQVPEHGALLELATDQAAEHKRRSDERNSDGWIAAHICEDDPLAWIMDSIGNATISTKWDAQQEELRQRGLNFCTALASGDDAELGRLLRIAVRLELLPIIARGEI